MRELTIDENSAGQRLDRFLGRYLNRAPASFFYRMMRKKNITLNGKKCGGSERLNAGDTVTLYLSEETIGAFREAREAARRLPETLVKLDIVYEDSDFLLVNKPAGMLSQKAKAGDISLTEYAAAYLARSGSAKDSAEGEIFSPSVCNRLDRNTSGLVICGKTPAGAREASRLLRERTVKKTYLCLADGVLRGERRIEGYLRKDEQTNRVTVLSEPDGKAAPTATVCRSLADNGSVTLLEVELITGKSHQIRAHLAGIGHAVIGDRKYGGGERMRQYEEKYGLRVQLLHSWRLEFPQMEGRFAYLSGRRFTAAVPPVMRRVLMGEGLWLPGIQED